MHELDGPWPVQRIQIRPTFRQNVECFGNTPTHVELCQFLQSVEDRRDAMITRAAHLGKQATPHLLPVKGSQFSFEGAR
jgi:hypothetical protein